MRQLGNIVTFKLTSEFNLQIFNPLFIKPINEMTVRNPQ